MKIDREAVYKKYGGKCAYCGRDLDLKKMQVDHIVPVRDGGTNERDNLNPSCRICNHYKRGDSLEFFRQWKLGKIIDRLSKIYIFRVAVQYGMIETKEWDKKFYYEKEDKETEDKIRAWHDLRKEPDDLPKDSREVLVCRDSFGRINYINGYYDKEDSRWYVCFDDEFLSVKSPFAWCELPMMEDLQC